MLEPTDLTSGARATARCKALAAAPFSDMTGGLYRGYLTPAHRATLDQIGLWMVEAGMHARVDAAANLVGRFDGSEVDAPALVIGSHLDSVRNGGAYDGPLGVLLAIECVAMLHQQGRRMPFPIEIYGFGDEEGSRFPAAMLTSRAVAGTLDTDLMAIVDSDGFPLANAIRLFNADHDLVCAGRAILPEDLSELGIATFHNARRRPGTTLAYLEAHIEQGPVLEAEGLAVGTVTGIAAQLRYQIEVAGIAGHAGTTSMALRRDPLAGAAAMILAIEEIARADASDLVATVGRIEARPGAPNVIVGAVTFSIDIRAGEAPRRDRAAATILEAIARIAAARQLGVATALVHDLPASPCDPALMAMIDAAIADAGHPPRRLVSGAGHDAMVMAALCPTAMLFIRCRGGVSHNPAEHVEAADVEIAQAVMSGFIDRLGATYEPA